MRHFSLAFITIEIVLCELKALHIHVTIRDFLPIQCLVEYGMSYKVEDAWGKPAYKLHQMNNDACQGLLNQNQWTNAFITGDVAGHPDFEASGLYSTQPFCTASDPDLNLQFPVGTCIFEESEQNSIIADQLHYGTNGIGKPIYCSSEMQCGLVGNKGAKTQSNRESFSTWFHDDPKYNRRIGHVIELKQSETQNFTYEFNGNREPVVGFLDDNDANFFGPLDMFKIDGSREVDAHLLPKSVSAWPQTMTRQSLISRGYWFTTELHTFFEYRNDKAMKLTFSGDDDFWAFINGKLAVDVGGMHSTRTRSIDLNEGNEAFNYSDLLGLQHEGVYSLDIFHAERQRSGSNFKLTTTLFPSCSSSQAFKFEMSNFIRNEFAMKGATIIDSDTMLLLSSEVHFQASFAFSKKLFYFNQGLKLSILAQFEGDIEGFAMLLTTQKLVDVPQTTGLTLNIPHDSSSLVLRFNLCKNKKQLCSTKQVELSLHQFGHETIYALEELRFNLKSKEAFPIRMVYHGEKTQIIEVYLNDSLLLRSDSKEIVSFFKNNSLRVGFTGSSSELAENLFLSKLNVLSIPINISQSKIEKFYKQPNVTECNAWKKLPFRIVTVDTCGKDFRAGGFKQNFTAFSSQPETHLIEVRDNLDGTYDTYCKISGKFNLNKMNITFEFRNENKEIVQLGKYQLDLALNVTKCVLNPVKRDIKTIPFVPDKLSLKKIVAWIGSGGGLILLVCYSVFAMMRLRWSKNKSYVSSGNTYKLEVNTNLANDDELTKVAYEVLQSQQELSDLAAKTVNDPLQQAALKLKAENNEMKAKIRDLKESTQLIDTNELPSVKLANQKLDF